MNDQKICIIYWGLVRGFKYECAFNSHKKYLYDRLKDKNIDFDVYVVTNFLDYNEAAINKIPNVKLLKIIDINEILNCADYKTAYNNIQFTTIGWSNYFHNNLLTLYYTRQYLANIIPDNYKRYISMDIGQIIDKLEYPIIEDKTNITSAFETSNGINPRILIGNYNCILEESNIFNYILNTNIKLIFLNPETFIADYFRNKHISLTSSNLVNVLRIRTDGTNQNGIKYDLSVSLL
jgi:hypothetical protein